MGKKGMLNQRYPLDVIPPGIKKKAWHDNIDICNPNIKKV